MTFNGQFWRLWRSACGIIPCQPAFHGVKALRPCFSLFSRTLANLQAAIARLPHVLVYDNSDLNVPYCQVAVFERGQLRHLQEPVPEWLGPILPDGSRQGDQPSAQMPSQGDLPQLFRRDPRFRWSHLSVAGCRVRTVVCDAAQRPGVGDHLSFDPAVAPASSAHSELTRTRQAGRAITRSRRTRWLESSGPT
jgi:hypothetical protein